MSKNLRELVLNYRGEPILGDKVHVIARKNGEVVFDGYYGIYATIETNYSKIAINWPKDGIVPVEYRDYYGISNRYPVEIEYFEDDDIVHLSGEYLGDSYQIIIQLPEKRSL